MAEKNTVPQGDDEGLLEEKAIEKFWQDCSLPHKQEYKQTIYSLIKRVSKAQRDLTTRLIKQDEESFLEEGRKSERERVFEELEQMAEDKKLLNLVRKFRQALKGE